MTKHVILWLILALALIVRTRYLVQIEHNIDHAYPIWQAMMTLDRWQFPLAGQGTSVLFANPPLTGYLYLPVVALTRSMLGVYMLVILLNTLGVWMAYRAVLALLGWRLALVAAFLMAVNPWMIEYSRTSWVQALLPFFVPAVAWLLWPVLLRQARRPARRTILALLMATLLAHTYLLAFFIVAPVAVLMFVFRDRLNWRAVAVGVGIFTAMTALYGIGLLTQIDTVQQRVDDFSGAESRLNAEAFLSATRLVTGADYEIARGTLAPADDAALRRTLSRPFALALTVMLIVGIITAIRDILQRTARRDAAIIALVWFALPVIAMSYTGNPVHPFYQLMGIPAGYALTLWGLAALRPSLLRPALALTALVVLPFGALMLTNSARYYQETAARPGDHGFTALSVEYGLHVGAAIRQHLPEGGRVFIREAGWMANSYAGRLFDVVDDVRLPDFQIIPPEGGLIITMSAETPPLPVSGGRVESITMRDGLTITIDALPRADIAELTGEIVDIRSEQGLTLHRYTLRNDGETWTLQTVWRVDAVAESVLMWIAQPFIHVFDAEGIQTHNISGAGLPGYAWRPGDLHIHRTTFTASAPFTVQFGQFDSMGGARLIFVRDDGTLTGALTISAD